MSRAGLEPATHWLKASSTSVFGCSPLFRKIPQNSLITILAPGGKFFVVLACSPMLSSNVGANMGATDLLGLE
jgi:hypothetical protein